MKTRKSVRRPTYPNPSRTFRSHARAHAQVFASRRWYGDGPPIMPQSFSAAATAQRQDDFMGILYRAATSRSESAEAFGRLGDTLDRCSPRGRCGSLACLLCGRAIQRAKAVAQELAIRKLVASTTTKKLVWVCVVPRGMMYKPGTFHQIDIVKANRWLKDKLKSAGFKRPIIGSTDLGWEVRRSKGYIQVHWHLAFLTNSPKGLRRKLKAIFKQVKRYERPVDVIEPYDLGFLPYMNKTVKFKGWLRNNRRNLAELLLALHSIEPLNLLVSMQYRIQAKGDGFRFRKIGIPR